jgi:hypothetical protein
MKQSETIGDMEHKNPGARVEINNGVSAAFNDPSYISGELGFQST